MVRIVILGGGFAGTAVARRLEQMFGADAAVEITLVDRENFSLFTPLLPEVPSGAIEAKHVVSPLRAVLGRTVIRQADVRAVDLSSRIVLAAHCPNCQISLLPYDHLVVALGSVTNFFGLPGVAAHALTMKSLTDAIYLFKLPGLERKVRVALDWTLDLFFPRDIVYLRALHLAHGSETVTEAPPAAAPEPAVPHGGEAG